MITDSIRLDLRHTCEQDEGMAGYGWTTYDIRNGGSQTIHDSSNKLDFVTEFSKIPGGQHGGHWGVRVKGMPGTNAKENLKTIVILYVAMEDMKPNNESELECTYGQDDNESNDVQCQGEISGLGGFKIHVPADSHVHRKQRLPSKTFVKSLLIPENMIWNAKCKSFSFFLGLSTPSFPFQCKMIHPARFVGST